MKRTQILAKIPFIYNGYWFNHTWLLIPNENEQKSFVLETTYPCELYFGVVLTKSQLEHFKKNYRS